MALFVVAVVVISTQFNQHPSTWRQVLEKDWSYEDAAYHTWITASTVGYGDVAITTQARSRRDRAEM